METKFLKIVIIILLLINICTLAFMWMQKPGHGMHLPPPQEIGHFLTHELNFSETQEKQFELLRDEHRHSVEKLRKKSRELHDAFFDLLGITPVDSIKIINMADSITAVQKQIELSTFYHFQKVRTICTPEQQQKFDDVIKDALRMMAPRPHGR